MSRVFNFSAGPGVLPEPVLERIRDDALDWEGTGMSVMEHSHRGSDFQNLADATEAKIRHLAGIPDDYDVLFLHGPGRIHFSGVPLNLAGDGSKANYVDTGLWSQMATKEAEPPKPDATSASNSAGIAPTSTEVTPPAAAE